VNFFRVMGLVESLFVIESRLWLASLRTGNGLSIGVGRILPRWLLPHILHAAVRRNYVGQILIVLFQLHKV
jgi:hypothetical protein